MTMLVFGEPTRDGEERRYVRLETEGNTTWGTVPQSLLNAEAVVAAVDGERIDLDSLQGYYGDAIVEEFLDRPLSRFVDEFVRRTPYNHEQAAVIVTVGWFNMAETDARRAINQHLREIYDELSPEAFSQHIAKARRRREQIHAAERYPFGI